MNDEISAIIVAKKNSVRLPNKSLIRIGDCSLVGNKINQLKKCSNINRIIVGTDSDIIKEESESLGAEVVIRPDRYCDEKISSANDMISNMMDLIDTDIVTWTHCTNPLVKSETYELAIDTFVSNCTKYYDSLLSVTELREHLWDNLEKPLNYNPWGEKHVLASQIKPYYKQNGAIFIQRYEDMRANSYFFGKKPFLFVMDEIESIDINTRADYEVAKFWHERF